MGNRVSQKKIQPTERPQKEVTLVLEPREPDPNDLLSRLPSEIISHILNYMNLPKYLVSVSLVCKSWYLLVYDLTDFWTSYIQRFYYLINDEKMEHLVKKLHRKQHWNLMTCQNISDVSLNYLQTFCPMIKTLDLSWCSQLSDNAIFTFLKIKGTQLQSLNLSHTSAASHNEIVAIIAQDCPNLHTLGLRSSDSRLVVITDLPKLTNLQSLDINGRRISNENRDCLSKCTKLRQLSISQVDSSIVEQTLPSLPHLEHLDISEGSYQPNVIDLIMKSCPKLKSIHFPDLSRFGYEYFQKLDQFLASYAMQLENIDFNNLPGDGQLIVELLCHALRLERLKKLGGNLPESLQDSSEFFWNRGIKNAILHSPSLKELNLRNLWNAIYRKEINLILIEKPQLRVLWEANEVL